MEEAKAIEEARKNLAVLKKALLIDREERGAIGKRIETINSEIARTETLLSQKVKSNQTSELERLGFVNDDLNHEIQTIQLELYNTGDPASPIKESISRGFITLEQQNFQLEKNIENIRLEIETQKNKFNIKKA